MPDIFISGKLVDLIVPPFENYSRWFNDPVVCEKNSHHVFPFMGSEVQNFMESLATDRTRIVLGIKEKKYSKHIGNVSLQRIDHFNRSAELSIIIGDKSEWEKGYGTEAEWLLMKHGFESLGLHRIYSGMMETNQGAMDVVKKNGMKQYGIARKAVWKNGRWLDVIQFDMLDTEWNEKWSDLES
jgi:ribosomal-protein-alanine N-acetyltransferase